MPPEKRLQDLLFIDVETTGLDAQKHELIEVAAVRTGHNALVIKDKYVAKIKPINLAAAEPKALEINKYSEEEWSDANCTDPKEVALQINRISADAVLVGQNVSFDEGFLKALFSKVGVIPGWGYHKIDTVSLAWPLYVSTDLRGLSLSKLAAFLGISATPTHRALDDVMACREVYTRLMAKYT